MTFEIGPFTLYRASNGTLDISITRLRDYAIGWEFGWDDNMVQREPWLALRLGKLVIFSYEKTKKGFELWFFGFWWIA